MYDQSTDAVLLEAYARRGDQAAFEEVVRRRVALVYGCALRRLNGDSHLAEDVAQQVFSQLARDAANLARHAALGGWLFTTARNLAAQAVRTEARRRFREQEAQSMNELSAESGMPTEWHRLRPVLDETIDQLGERDREAVVLRFIEGRSFAEVGARLQLTENAARMRVERALDKMNALLSRRGVGSTTSALAVALTAQGSVTVPPGLVASVTAAATSSAPASVAAAAKFFSMSKLTFGVSGACAVAALTGLVATANSNAQLRDDVARLRNEHSSVLRLEAENARLARLAAEVEDLRKDDAQFVTLQREADAMRERLRVAARNDSQSTAPLDRTPTPQFQMRPSYPTELRQTGTGGSALIDFVVDANGNVKNATALAASHPEFAVAAQRAVSTWLFKPGQKGTRVVETRMRVPVVFGVNGEPTPEPIKSDPSAANDQAVYMAPFTVITDR